jgi:hypothetical protein
MATLRVRIDALSDESARVCPRESGQGCRGVAVFWVMVLVTGTVVVGVFELVLRFRRAAQTFDRIIDLGTDFESTPARHGMNELRREKIPGNHGT